MEGSIISIFRETQRFSKQCGPYSKISVRSIMAIEPKGLPGESSFQYSIPNTHMLSNMFVNLANYRSKYLKI